MAVIATWNVNSIRTRQNHFRNWVKERSPDIVLLQELKCTDQDFPKVLAHDLGYNFEVFGQKSYNGVAILAKGAIADVTRGLPGFEDEAARYIEAEIEGGIYASVYVPNGQEVGSEKFAYKLAFMKALTAHLATYINQDQITVIGGDYNIAPFPVDGHTAEFFETNRILCSPQERLALYELLNLGYQDAIRDLYPADLEIGRDLFSWWDYRAGSFENNKGYRIDHLLVSPKAADQLKCGGIDLETRSAQQPSDHAPVWIEIDT